MWGEVMKNKLALICVIGVLLFIHPLNAQTWTASKRLTWNYAHSSNPAIAVDSNNHLHVVWQDSAPGDTEIYYKKSTDGGAIWKTKRLTWNYGFSEYPAIAIDSSNNIHIVWHNDTPIGSAIYYMKSTNGGASWTTKRLTWNPGHYYYSTIAIDSSNNIHIVWCGGTPINEEIYYKKSTDGGASWTTKRLSWISGNSLYPTIAIDSGENLHVVWYDNISGNFEIYYKKSTNSGVSWTTKRVTWNSGKSHNPTIAIDSSNNIHVVWHDDTPNKWEIYYSRSTDGGTTWRTKRMTRNSGSSYYPIIAADSSDNIHVVWWDYDPGYSEIYYKRSTDGGGAWTTKRLTWNSEDSWYPAIAVDSNNHLHVVWQDRIPGNWEIYYKKGIQ
jgi:hypothetical protein